MAPSSILYYCGFSKKVDNLKHHNLFFDEDFGVHSKEIYEKPEWPSRPLFYLSAPSLTDTSLAPEGKENLFLLIPTAPGKIEDKQITDRYFAYVADKVKRHTGNDLEADTLFALPYGASNFIADYHALRGNAYGLANTLLQTAILKPAMRSKKVRNLLFAGQLTVPGPGVPPALISGEVAATEIMKDFPL
jgi:phytoene desaturase